MILSCGDALYDVFVAARPSGSSASLQLDARIGGSPLNVAIGLSRLGQPTGFFAKVSTDPLGQNLLAHLNTERVETGFCVRTDAPTTLAVVALDAKGVPTYSFYTDGTADRSLEQADLPARLPDAIRAIHIGSYATALQPTAGSLEALVTREHGRRFISYDPNVRPSIVPDRDVWRERVAALTAQAHLVKASLEDIEFLSPGADETAMLRDWLDRGVCLAVATRGDSGAIAMTRSGLAAEVESPRVNVIDTVGAGDTFQAALLTWLAEDGRMSPDGIASLSRRDLADMLDFAARAAAITCSRRGADLPRRGDV